MRSKTQQKDIHVLHKMVLSVEITELRQPCQGLYVPAVQSAESIGRERLKHAHSPTHPLSSPSDENPKRMHEATRVASRQRGHRQTGEEGAEEETRRTGQSQWWWW